ncbi:hypothetical protein AX774_g5162 [Zancudomyces culisetae]|uniref:Uncharacterized protein n=1 Tax=Zancudomyces culisetae TaxID=1213189 RepID=A0A1R1PKC0_ZANCU|nr:hypothetical protein AX774_g5162 [Zancudomyces culisetae]|eukprot:OMH81379.1 hypothetical protein AX774_g5162 [Zancudomyces culisetae]
MDNTTSQELVEQLQALTMTMSKLDEEIKNFRPDLIYKPHSSFIEHMPSTKNDFYRSYLPDEDKRVLLYESHKFKGMNYTHPQINETFGPAIKKTDRNLYKIQQMLAQSTRYIDTMAYEVVFKKEKSAEGMEICWALQTT